MRKKGRVSIRQQQPRATVRLKTAEIEMPDSKFSRKEASSRAAQPSNDVIPYETRKRMTIMPEEIEMRLDVLIERGNPRPRRKLKLNSGKLKHVAKQVQMGLRWSDNKKQEEVTKIEDVYDTALSLFLSESPKRSRTQIHSSRNRQQRLTRLKRITKTNGFQGSKRPTDFKRPSSLNLSQSGATVRTSNLNVIVSPNHNFAHNHKFAFEPGSSKVRQSNVYRRQGNSMFYTEAAESARQNMTQSPRVAGAIEQFWRLLPSVDAALEEGKGSGQVYISKQEYIDFELRICKALFEPQDFTVEAALEAAESDWKNAETNGEKMGHKAFFSGMFEVADIWTDSIDESDYVDFLDTLYSRIVETRVVSGDETHLSTERVVMKDLEFIYANGETWESHTEPKTPMTPETPMSSTMKVSPTVPAPNNRTGARTTQIHQLHANASHRASMHQAAARNATQHTVPRLGAITESDGQATGAPSAAAAATGRRPSLTVQVPKRRGEGQVQRPPPAPAPAPAPGLSEEHQGAGGGACRHAGSAYAHDHSHAHALGSASRGLGLGAATVDRSEVGIQGSMRNGVPIFQDIRHEYVTDEAPFAANRKNSGGQASQAFPPGTGTGWSEVKGKAGGTGGQGQGQGGHGLRSRVASKVYESTLSWRLQHPKRGGDSPAHSSASSRQLKKGSHTISASSIGSVSSVGSARSSFRKAGKSAAFGSKGKDLLQGMHSHVQSRLRHQLLRPLERSVDPVRPTHFELARQKPKSVHSHKQRHLFNPHSQAALLAPAEAQLPVASALPLLLPGQQLEFDQGQLNQCFRTWWHQDAFAKPNVPDADVPNIRVSTCPC